jgi:hypothetical protein
LCSISTGGTGVTSAAGTARLATQEHEEIEAGGCRHAGGDRGRKRAGHVIAECDDFLCANANAAKGDAVNDLARVIELTHDRTVRAPRFGGDLHGLIVLVDRRHDRCEAIAIVVRDRDDNV